MAPALPEELLASIFDQLALGQPMDFDDFERTTSADKMATGDYAKFCQEYIHVGVSTLCSVCLASKTFHRLAWPILYRTFDDKVFKLSPFLRTIALKPEYGMALHTLRSTSWTALEGLEAHEFFELLQSDATLTALFQWRARGFWLGEDAHYQERPGMGDLKSSLLRSPNLGSQDGYMVLLLLVCPNIRELNFSPPLDISISVFARFLMTVLSKGFQSQGLPETDDDFEQEESDYVLAQMFGAHWPPQTLRKPQVLQRLRSLTVRYPGIPDMGPSIFLNLMSVPSLSKLHFNSLRGSSGRTKHNLQRASECRSLETLELEDCQLQTSELAAIIRRCPQLATLTVRWASIDDILVPTDSAFDEPWCLKYGEVGEAIAQHAPKIRLLTLDSYGGWQSMGAEPKHPYILGDTLASLPDLKCLVIDERAIWGSAWGVFGHGLARTIPKGLHGLSIKSPQWEHDSSNAPTPQRLSEFHAMQDAEVNDLLKNENFPELTSVKIAGRIIRYDHGALLRHGWRSSSSDDTDGAGITYRYHNFERKAGT